MGDEQGGSLKPPEPPLDPPLKVRENMRGVRYDDLQELEVAVYGHVKKFEHDCLATRNWNRRSSKIWRSVIEHKGY